jgi:hypothetical protein
MPCRQASALFASHNEALLREQRHFEAGVDFKVIVGWIGHKDGGVLVAKTYGHLPVASLAGMNSSSCLGVRLPSAIGLVIGSLHIALRSIFVKVF